MILTKKSNAIWLAFGIGLLMAILLAYVSTAAAAAPVSDDALYNQVKIKLAGDQVVKGAALDIEVKNGVVTLTVPVEQEKQKDRAERIVRRVKGVKQVVNRITIRARDGGK